MDKKLLKRVKDAAVNAMGLEDEDHEMSTFRAEVPPWIVLKMLFEIEDLQRRLDKAERKK